MPIEVSVPRLGWNMETGTFAGWLKADGDTVRPGDALFRLEGEKATEEIESIDGGVLRLLADGPKVGDVVAVGVVIGYLLMAGEVATVSVPTPSSNRLEDEPTAPHLSPSGRGRTECEARGSGEGSSLPPSNPSPVSPRARRAAARLGIDISQLAGDGTTGRVRERDVLAAAPVPAQPTDLIPHTPIRRATAARMVASLRETAPVTLNTAVDAANLANLRGQFKAAGGIVPSFTDFLVKLAGFALQQHPVLASRWSDAGLIPAARIDIGIAVDTDAGLLVPVVRDVPTLGLRAVAARTRVLIELARGGRTPAADMGGACFTITNLGALGIDTFTPIINPPEAAVLGVGRLDRRPVVRGDEIVIREQLSLSLTFDHRVTDGAPAARFLQTLGRLIENPGPWLST